MNEEFGAECEIAVETDERTDRYVDRINFRVIDGTLTLTNPTGLVACYAAVRWIRVYRENGK